jgi:digeranylgeranylglycerophospholipid reductase
VPACASDSSDVFLGADIVGGYGWLFPRDGEANLGVGVAAQARRSLKPLLERLHRALAARARVGARVLRQTGGAIPVGGRLRCHGRRAGTAVLLAGDAAGLANPITGAGIAAAVQSGDLAGSAAAAWLAGDDAALADYADELAWLFDASLARARQRRAELMADYRGGGRPSAAALRRAWIAYPEYWAAPAPQGVPS